MKFHVSGSTSAVISALAFVTTGHAAIFENSGQALGDAFTWQVLPGDLDNDDHIDLVALDEFNWIRIYFGGANGVFSFSSPHSFQRSTAHRSGALGLLDTDENLDLVVGGDGSPAGLTVYTGDGSGNFAEVWSFNWPSAEVNDISLGDINGDSSLDIVAVGFFSGQDGVQVCINNGTHSYDCNGIPSSVFIGRDAVLVDLDEDQDLDLVVASDASFPNDSSIVILLNTGGALIDANQPVPADFPYGLAAGDVDGDGDVDLVVGNQASAANRVLLNDGAGNFTDSGQSLGSEATNDVVLGDIDLDDDLDLVSINEGHNGRGYVVYTNNGSGAFQEQEFGSGNFKSTGSLVDVDGDGDLDLITADYGTSPSSNHAPNQVYFNGTVTAEIPAASEWGLWTLMLALVAWATVVIHNQGQRQSTAS